MIRRALPVVFFLACGCSSMQRSIRDSRQTQPDQIRYAIVEDAAAHWPADTVLCLSLGKEPVTDQLLTHIRADTATVLRETDCGDWRRGNEPRFEHFVGLDIEGLDLQGDHARANCRFDTRSGNETRAITLVRGEGGEWRVVKKEEPR